MQGCEDEAERLTLRAELWSEDAPRLKVPQFMRQARTLKRRRKA